MDRLQRASPFAGGPGGKASWWVQGQSPCAWSVQAIASRLTNMARQRNDRGGCAGFTLIEVLAALAVLGMILIALSTGLRFGRQALLAQTRSTATENQVGPVDAALRSLIAKAWPGAVGAEARFAGTAR